MSIGTAAAVLAGALSVAFLAGYRLGGLSTLSGPSHARRGIVKSIDATTLVMTRTGRTPGEMQFALTPGTHREGPIAVGTPIQVRFWTDGRRQVATAILASPPTLHAVGSAP